MKRKSYSRAVFNAYLSALRSEIDVAKRAQKAQSLKEWLLWLKKKKTINSRTYNLLLLELNKELKSNIKTHPSQPAFYYNISFLLAFTVIAMILSLISLALVFQSRYANQAYDENKDKLITIPFQGVLKESDGTPVDSKRDVYFHLYSTQTSNEPIYIGACIGEQGLTPEYDGSFTIVLGADCNMPPLTQEFFDTYDTLYLGVQIGTNKEISPRFPITSKNYVKNAAMLQGLTIGSIAGTIPHITTENTIDLHDANPTISSTDGTFTIEGKRLTLSTTQEQGGDIYIQPAIGSHTIITSGKLGIGTLKPSDKLSVVGIEPYASIARISNLSPEDSDTSSVLDLAIGTEQNGTNSTFVNFYSETSRTVLGTKVGSIRLGNGGVVYETRGADFAEYFETKNKEVFKPYMIVGINTDGIFPASYGDTIIGVVSSTPGFVGNYKHNERDESILVGLIGQVEVLVTTENGQIRTGDRITTSSIPGYGAKALSPNETTIGIALENSAEKTVTPEACPYRYNKKVSYNKLPLACGEIRILIDLSR